VQIHSCCQDIGFHSLLIYIVRNYTQLSITSMLAFLFWLGADSVFFNDVHMSQTPSCDSKLIYYYGPNKVQSFFNPNDRENINVKPEMVLDS
jgi:hypothetical protein